MQTKVLTVTDARKQGTHDPLWVLNNTVYHSHLPKQFQATNANQRANVVFTLRNSNSELATIPVFATWVPVCLSEIAPKDAILNSQSFMKAINIRKLVIIDEASAQQLLKQLGATEEIERVRKMDINTATGDALGVIETESETTKIETLDKTTQEAGLSAQVISFIELMETGTGIESLNSLRTLGNLEREEWIAVLRKAQSLGDTHKEVANFCKESLNAKS